MSALFVVVCFFNIVLSHKTNLTIFAITSGSSSDSTTVGSQWLAIQEINNNSELLSNYLLHLKVVNVGEESRNAVIAALDLIKYKSTKDHIYFPIVLGAPWSLLSTATAPVFAAYNMGQISASSTSIDLSNTDRYQYFYRTIPSDALQAEGLILLCVTFNWTSIAIVYVNDVYGLYLSFVMQNLGKKYGIDSVSIAISYDDDATYYDAAEQIQKFQTYIILLVVHETLGLFTAFDKAEIVGYPYFYLGVDGWFDMVVLESWNATKATQGFIGTLPWQTNSFLSFDVYDNNTRKIVNESLIKYNRVLELWKYYYNNGYSDKLHSETPVTYMIYAYDAVYSIAYAIEQIDSELLYTDSGKLIERLNNIMTNNIDFIGLSGHVLFDEVGDRVNGLYSFGNNVNGTIEYFGYFYYNESGDIVSKTNFDKIVWPKYFTDRGIIPRSDVLIHEQILTITKWVSISVFAVLCLSLLIAFMFAVFFICYRENKVIRAASWKLNVLMCFGAILCYIAILLCGIDEALIANKVTLDILCNIRLWLITISYTIIFMPLFMKTYRLSRLFKSIVTDNIVKDKSLFIGIAICVMIDIVLLSIFTLIKPHNRMYHSGSTDIIDELQKIQYIYGICATNQHIHAYVIFWKIIELVFGLYVALDVSKINTMSNLFNKFDETGIQLMSILFTFIIICVAATIFMFGDINHPNFYFLRISIAALLIGNIVVFLNLLPRTIAVITRNEMKYELAPIEKMELKIRKSLNRISSRNDNKKPLLSEKDVSTTNFSAELTQCIQR